MARTIATNTTVTRAELLEFLRSRRNGILVTSRADGAPQLSPVTYGVDPQGRVVVSTYPERAKVRNLKRRPAASFMALGEGFNEAWVQVDGTAEVLDVPESVEPLVDYFRAAAGKEHPDWDEYRAAMVAERRVLLTAVVDRVYGRVPPAG